MHHRIRLLRGKQFFVAMAVVAVAATVQASHVTLIEDGQSRCVIRVASRVRHVPYRNDKGQETAEAEGYCQPFSFDVTAAVQAGASNQISIAGTRVFMSELGTGGLLGPVVLYRER